MSHNPAPQTSTKTSGPRQRTAPRFTRRRRRKAAEAAAVVDRLTFNAHIINTGTTPTGSAPPQPGRDPRPPPNLDLSWGGLKSL